MSDNISLPSIEEVNQWNPKQVIAFLESYNDKQKLYLRNEDIKIIKDNWVYRGEFVALYGSRASGKSTRNVIKLQSSFSQLSVMLPFPLYSASFEHVSMNNVDLFWQTLGMKLQHTVILFDEFDMLYNATDDVLTSCMTTLRVTLRGIKAKPELYFGTSTILYKEFADEYELKINQKVIEDMYIQTNGKLPSEIGLHLSHDSWQYFTTFLLGNAILEYPMFIRMKDAFLNKNLWML
ncbi:1246_t:CDS:2 [Dentiscutata heterogama]|uniref:1246_t:CDS:1 n=1 Tax=Dentiscutata heterogama TaxID=1316150 RepID=A0ACA9LKE5_9GLOM|nr:1246_t:CDS:2 [Dentiscutata heterogama]